MNTKNLLSLAIVFASLTQSFGQSLDNDKEHQKRVNRFITLNRMFYEFSQKSIQDDLELTDVQRAKLKVMIDEFKALERKVMLTKDEIVDQQQYMEDWKTAEKFIDKSWSDIKATLLPHQKIRWNQIRWQKMTGWNQSPRGLSSGKIEKKLQLTDKQKKRIEAIAAEMEAKILKLRLQQNDEIRTVIAKNRAKSMKVFDLDQRKKYFEKIGKILK